MQMEKCICPTILFNEKTEECGENWQLLTYLTVLEDLSPSVQELENLMIQESNYHEFRVYPRIQSAIWKATSPSSIPMGHARSD